MRIGAILFDANNIKGGDQTLAAIDGAWASIEGGKVKRINSVHDLPNDVIWLTNLDWVSMMASRLLQHAAFRPASWMRSTVARLTYELGVDEQSVDRACAVQVLSALASNVVKLAVTQHGAAMVHGRTLIDELAIAHQLPKPALPDMLHTAFATVATHSITRVIENVSVSNKLPQLRVGFNRVLYARRMLETPLPPDTGWEVVKDIPADKNDRWLESVTQPFLVKVRISDMNQQIAEVTSFGSGSRTVREWITDLEWRELRKHCRMDVLAAYVCQHEPAISPIAARLPQGPLDELSVSQGVLAENLWLTHCRPRSVERPGGKDHYYSAAAAWLRSADRMALLSIAMKLRARGVGIISYSIGGLEISYVEADLVRVLGICAEHSLHPPRSLINQARRLHAAPPTRPATISDRGLFPIDSALRALTTPVDYRNLDDMLVSTELNDETKYVTLEQLIARITNPSNTTRSLSA